MGLSGYFRHADELKDTIVVHESPYALEMKTFSLNKNWQPSQPFWSSSRFDFICSFFFHLRIEQALVIRATV